MITAAQGLIEGKEKLIVSVPISKDEYNDICLLNPYQLPSGLNVRDHYGNMIHQTDYYDHVF